MKPSWDNAPKWANYLAMEDSGEWYWYEEEPECDHIFSWYTTGRWKEEGSVIGGNVDWEDSLEKRPE